MIGRRTTTITASTIAFLALALLAVFVVIRGWDSSSTATPVAAVAAVTQPTPTVVAMPTKATPAKVTPSKAPASRRTASPVPFDTLVSARPGVVVGAISIREKSVTSHLPGETSGASYLVTVTVTNNGSDRVDLAATVVNLYVGSTRRPAVETSSVSKPVRASLAAHRSARGTYVFRRPAGASAPLVVEVDLGATSTVVPFQGPAPSAR